MAKLNVEADAAALAAGAARRVGDLLAAALTRTGAARLCLTGGRTPRDMYERLGAGEGVARIDWSRVHLFWGDERHVPPDHPDSNFGLASTALVQPAAVPADHVHRIRGELPDASDAAREYDGLVRQFSRQPDATFDVMLLGLGADAHIASLFPRSPLLEDVAVVRDSELGEEQIVAAGRSGQRVAAVWAAHLNAWRVTLTPSALLDSAAILVITSGAAKAAAVRAAIQGSDDPRQFPAQLLRAADERVEWWIDGDAAAAIR